MCERKLGNSSKLETLRTKDKGNKGTHLFEVNQKCHVPDTSGISPLSLKTITGNFVPSSHQHDATLGHNTARINSIALNTAESFHAVKKIQCICLWEKCVPNILSVANINPLFLETYNKVVKLKWAKKSNAVELKGKRKEWFEKNYEAVKVWESGTLGCK